MARGVNKVILVGNLGKDPEVKYTAGGTAVCNFSIATSESWKDKTTGEKQERTEWHSIVCWSGLAEIAGEYLRKGSQVYVEGKLQTRKWEDKEGNTRYTTEIVIHDMQMLGGRAGGGDEEAARPAKGKSKDAGNAYREASGGASAGTGGGGAGDFDDDIPFSPIDGRYV